MAGTAGTWKSWEGRFQCSKKPPVGFQSPESRSGIIFPGFESWLCQVKAECSLGLYLASQSLSFLIYKMGAITIPIC